jgi:hypothetical protein
VHGSTRFNGNNLDALQANVAINPKKKACRSSINGKGILRCSKKNVYIKLIVGFFDKKVVHEKSAMQFDKENKKQIES